MENVMRGSSAAHRAGTGEKTMLAGIVTGQIAGLIMAVVVMLVFTVFLGKGPLYPVQVIGSALFGESALQGINVAAVLPGLVLHQAGPSLLWGAIFGWAAPRLHVKTPADALKIGIGLGVITMVDVYLIIPALFMALHGVDIWNREVPMAWDWAAHLVFGASFVLYPAVLKKLGGKA